MELSYSGHAKTDVYLQLEKCIWLNKFEESCHWLVEIDQSKWLDDWWTNTMIPWLAQHVYEYNPKLGIFVHKMNTHEKDAKWISHVISFAIYIPKSKPLIIRNIDTNEFVPHVRHPLISTDIKDVRWVHIASLLLYSIKLQQPWEAIKMANILYAYNKKSFYAIYKYLARHSVDVNNSTATTVIRCWYPFYKRYPIVIFHIIMILAGPANWNTPVSPPSNEIVKNAENRMHLLRRDIREKALRASNRKSQTVTYNTSLEKMNILFDFLENPT